MLVRLKGIHKVTMRLAGGALVTYYYLRDGGGRLKPLPEDEGLKFHPGTVAFMRAYNDRVGGVPRNRVAGSLKSILADYMISSVYAGLSDRTRRDYSKQIVKIEDEFGTLPIDALNDVGVRGEFFAWRDRNALRSKRQADMAIQVLRTVLNWALDSGRISHNFAARPGITYKADRAEMIWLDEHEIAFLRVAEPDMRLAFLLAVNTGQRKGDLIKLPLVALKHGRIVSKQGKRGKPINIPITGELQVALDAAAGYRHPDCPTVLFNMSGHPMTLSGFQGRWRRTFLAAGLGATKLHFHDLRGTTCTLLAEAGCNDNEIASVLGWELDYVSKMRTIYQASLPGASDSGIEKLVKERQKRAANSAQTVK